MPVTTRSKSKAKNCSVTVQPQKDITPCSDHTHFRYEQQIPHYECLKDKSPAIMDEFIMVEVNILTAMMCKFIYFIDTGILCMNIHHLMESRSRMVADYLYLYTSATEVSDEMEKAFECIDKLLGQLDHLIATRSIA